MSKFENLSTGVVVSVDDSKDERFADGWKPAGTASPAKARKASSASTSSE